MSFTGLSPFNQKSGMRVFILSATGSTSSLWNQP